METHHTDHIVIRFDKESFQNTRFNLRRDCFNMIDDIFTNIIDCHGNNTEQIKQEVSIYYLLQRMFIFLAFYDHEEVDVAEFLHDNPVSKP